MWGRSPCRCDLWGLADTACLWSASETKTEAPHYRKSPMQQHHCESLAGLTWCLWQWWFCRFLHCPCWKTQNLIKVTQRLMSVSCTDLRTIHRERGKWIIFTLPCDITDVFLFIHHHAQRTSSGSKHMQRLRITRQLLSGSSSQDDCPAAGLGNAILTGLMKREASNVLVSGKPDISHKNWHLRLSFFLVKSVISSVHASKLFISKQSARKCYPLKWIYRERLAGEHCFDLTSRSNRVGNNCIVVKMYMLMWWVFRWSLSNL